MYNLPAICDNCSNVFPSGFSGGSGVTMITLNSKSGPCPYCGAMGSVPNGIYKIINEVEAILQIDYGKDVYKLQRILNTTNQNESLKSIEKKIKNETPQYEGIIETIEYLFTKTKNTFAAIGIVSAIVFGILSTYNSQLPNEEHDKKDDIIHEQRKIIEDYKNLNEEYKEKKKDKDQKEE